LKIMARHFWSASLRVCAFGLGSTLTMMRSWKLRPQQLADRRQSGSGFADQAAQLLGVCAGKAEVA
jgi:hypothetical protein